jgi:plastocyanin
MGHPIRLRAACAGLLALIACDPGHQTGVQGASGAYTVSVLDHVEFTPASINVPAGQTVTWAWFGNNTFPHNVTFSQPVDGGQVSSPTQTGGQFQHTFMTPGQYPYTCTVHNTHGVVVVH